MISFDPKQKFKFFNHPQVSRLICAQNTSRGWFQSIDSTSLHYVTPARRGASTKFAT